MMKVIVVFFFIDEGIHLKHNNVFLLNANHKAGTAYLHDFSYNEFCTMTSPTG